MILRSFTFFSTSSFPKIIDTDADRFEALQIKTVVIFTSNIRFGILQEIFDIFGYRCTRSNRIFEIV